MQLLQLITAYNAGFSYGTPSFFYTQGREYPSRKYPTRLYNWVVGIPDQNVSNIKLPYNTQLQNDVIPFDTYMTTYYHIT